MISVFRYETININLQSKPAWFLDSINPLGQVPALQLNDTIVYDSLICNDYLDEVYPGDRLVPSDPYLRTRDKMLMEHYIKVNVLSSISNSIMFSIDFEIRGYSLKNQKFRLV